MKPIVYIVDDDDAMRHALCQLLINDGLRVAAYADGPSFLRDCDGNSEGCVLLDQAMPGMTGEEVHAKLIARGISIAVVFLTGHGDIPTAVSVVKSGAIDFLEKPIQGDLLLSRVRRALALDRERRQAEREAREVRDRYATLSPREREVMTLVVSGLSNKEIARKLNISHRTVEIHRIHTMQKMGANSLPALVKFAAMCKS
ncbi:MAG: response regulator [Xanthomonadales bacterium]|nr:response regulator [Xanthomonadales bacterium]